MNSAPSINKNWCNLFTKHVNSSMIADILNEMGIEGKTVTGYDLNLKNKRIFGKASTLKIRKLGPGENPDGIYNALKSYSMIDDGDIIVVENEVPNLAYFGELNANLAIRSGAIGTIVGGATRDIENVSQLDYPVFSKGYSSADIKDYGTLESINTPITLDSTAIYPGDYIIADVNGIVVIPKENLNEVVSTSINSAEREESVKINILKGIEAFGITKISGNF